MRGIGGFAVWQTSFAATQKRFDAKRGIPMKKSKKSTGFEEKLDPMAGLDFEPEDEDDEIIDLEDIIEMPASSIDEDEDLDLDVEILDVDEDFDSGIPRKPVQKEAPFVSKGASPKVGDEEEDLLKSFVKEFEEAEEDLFDKMLAEKMEKEPSPKGGGEISRAPSPSEASKDSDMFEAIDQSLLDDLFDTDEREVLSPEKKVDLKERAAAALKVVEDTRSAESEQPLAEVTDTPEIPAAVPAHSGDLIEKTVEELIGQMESRLLENIRSIIDSKLPDIVRSIISEEIEKLKKEV